MDATRLELDCVVGEFCGVALDRGELAITELDGKLGNGSEGEGPILDCESVGSGVELGLG